MADHVRTSPIRAGAVAVRPCLCKSQMLQQLRFREMRVIRTMAGFSKPHRPCAQFTVINSIYLIRHLVRIALILKHHPRLAARVLNIGMRLRAQRPPRPKPLRLCFISSDIVCQQDMVTSLAALPGETVGEIPAIHFAWQLPAQQAGDARKQVHGADKRIGGALSGLRTARPA